MSNVVRVPQLPWHGRNELELAFPDSWSVEVCHIAGHDRPAMRGVQIRDALATMIGMPPLREFARGREEVAIIFDDITRVTRVSTIVPHLLRELAEAGIRDEKIRFIAAIGNHAAMDREDLAKKLGEEVLARFPVYNHNAHDNCVSAGTTSRGTRLLVNAEVMQCDLKISLCAVTPHMATRFGGGGKMILPGVASIDSVATNHALPTGRYEANDRRLDMEEAARLAGLDVAIESLVNEQGETVALFAGAEAEAHAAAVDEAQRHYLCPKAEQKGIVIANTYAKVMEAGIGVRAGESLGDKGGSLVLIANTPSGQVVHYLGGVWGRLTEGRRKMRIPLPERVHRLIFFTEYPDIAGLGFFEPAEKVTQINAWDEVVRTFRRYHEEDAAVAVYPGADILYFD
jgi:nickel-dependent lactate racemase